MKFAAFTFLVCSSLALAEGSRLHEPAPPALPSSWVTFESLLEKNLDQHPELRAYQKEIEALHVKGEETFWPLGGDRRSKWCAGF